ncbi:MAG: trypsin-like peptidase domain-containing protein [Planctomycetaceae bacterium]|nr:trypsin-like peptidase domain-containing protein [Planctomycetaceae bacterium]
MPQDFAAYKQQIFTTLRDSFSQPELERLLDFDMNVKLSHIAKPGNDEAVFYEVVDWAKRNDRLVDLFEGAFKARPRNATLNEIANQVGKNLKAEHVRVVEELTRLDAHDTRREQLLESVPDLPGLEAVAVAASGAVDFSASSFVARYYDMRRRICAIGSREAHVGTGFLIGPDCIMTNYHVVQECRRLAEPILATFDLYDETPLNELPRLGVNVDNLLAESIATQLDMAILQLDSTPEGNRGHFELSKYRPEFRETLFVMGHPGGRNAEAQSIPLPLSIRYGALFDHDSHSRRISYSARTSPGSSGSPVFRENCELMGLHHHGEHLVNNHGIPMWAIIEHLEQRGMEHLVSTATAQFENENSHNTVGAAAYSDIESAETSTPLPVEQPPDRTAVIFDENRLLSFLFDLTNIQVGMLLTRLPDATGYVSETGPVKLRINELIGYARGKNSCGMDGLARACVITFGDAIRSQIR